MAYIPIQQDQNVPKNLKSFVSDQLDMQFHDVHCMLRLPMKDLGLDAGCNFAAANCILSLISGLAALTCPRLSTDRIAGHKFTEVMLRYYPWDLKLAQLERERRTKHLYDFFRNPLAHSFGVRTKGNFWVNISRVNAMTEFRLEELEKGDQLYEELIYEPVNVKGEDIEKITLVVDHLYANARKMLRTMISDTETAIWISANLTSVGVK